MAALDRRELLLACGATLTCTGGASASGPIDEQGFAPIGGIEQWIAIQGEDASQSGRCETAVNVRRGRVAEQPAESDIHEHCICDGINDDNRITGAR